MISSARSPKKNGWKSGRLACRSRTSFVGSEEPAQVLDSDPPQLEVAVDVEGLVLEDGDHLRAVLAEFGAEAARELVLKCAQPRQQHFALRGGKIGVAQRANGVAHAIERNRALPARSPVRHSQFAQSFPVPLHPRMVTAMPQQFDRAAIDRVVSAIADEL